MSALVTDHDLVSLDIWRWRRIWLAVGACVVVQYLMTGSAVVYWAKDPLEGTRIFQVTR